MDGFKNKAKKRWLGTIVAGACSVLLSVSAVGAVGVGGAVGAVGVTLQKASAFTAKEGFEADWTSDDLLLTAANASTGAGARFNGNVLTQIAKAGGYETTAAMISAAKKGDAQGAQFLHDPTDGDAVDNGVQILFGGYYWIPVYLTTDKNGNAILDLWLAQDAAVCQWNTWYNGNTSFTYPSNMYSSSYIRSQLTGSDHAATANASALTANTAWSTDSEWVTFLTDLGWTSANGCSFLAKPSEVAYQETEAITDYAVKARSAKYLCPNDAYGAIDSTSWYRQVDYGTSNPKEGYAAWQNDYLWLPSLTETGDSSYAGMWGLTKAEQSDAANSWLRSGDINAFNAYVLDSSDSANGVVATTAITTNRYGVRPAMHLNLSVVAGAAADVTYVETPADVSVTYTGEEVKLADIASQLTWYDGKVMNVTLPKNCVAAGEYTVTAEMTDETYRFTSGGASASFGMTIEPKAVKVKWTAGENGAVYAELDNANGEQILDGDKGSVVLKTVYTDLTTSTEYEKPSKIGKYRATAVLQSKDGESENYKNYKIADENKTAEFDYTGISVTVAADDIVWQCVNSGVNGGVAVDFSGFSGNAVTYNGSAYTLQIDESRLPAGVKVKAYSGNAATNAGEYTATVALEASGEEYNYVNADAEPFAIDWKIEKKTIDLVWVMKEQEDPNGFTYQLPVLSENGELVEYSYFKSDANGVEGDEVALDDIVVDIGRMYYVVKAALKDDNTQNYTLNGTASCPFSLDPGPTLGGNVGGGVVSSDISGNIGGDVSGDVGGDVSADDSAIENGSDKTSAESPNVSSNVSSSVSGSSSGVSSGSNVSSSVSSGSNKSDTAKTGNEVKKGMPVGGIIGIVVGCVVIVGVIAAVVVLKLKGKKKEEE